MFEFKAGEYYHVKINRKYHKMDAIIRIIEATTFSVEYEIIKGHDTDSFGTKTSGDKTVLSLKYKYPFRLLKKDVIKLDKKICEVLYNGEVSQSPTDESEWVFSAKGD